MVVQLGIEDFAYFIFCFAVQFYWWGGRLFSMWEGVQEGRFELGDVENGVDPLELLQEADCNRVHAWGAYYLEQSQCHGTTSLPLLHPPLATSNCLRLHSASSASAPLQLQCILPQLVQLHCTYSQTNHRSTLDPFVPGSHAKGRHLYTPSTFA